jgi:hypothetical protein
MVVVLKPLALGSEGQSRMLDGLQYCAKQGLFQDNTRNKGLSVLAPAETT